MDAWQGVSLIVSSRNSISLAIGCLRTQVDEMVAIHEEEQNANHNISTALNVLVARLTPCWGRQSC